MRVNAKTSAIVLTIAILSCCAMSPEARRDKFLSRGKAFTEKKEYTRALLEFKNAAKVTPNDPEVYYQMGNAFMRLRDGNAAYIAFRKAVELNPGHVDAQLKLAQLQTTSSDPEMIKDAENRLKELLQKGSSTSDMLTALAFAELKLGNTQGAVENFEQALVQAPTELFAVVMLANAKLAQKDVKGAQAVLEKAVNDAPKSAGARKLLGDFFAGQNKPAEAEAALRQALMVDPNYGPALLDLAKLQRAHGQNDQAEQLYKKLSTLDGYKSSYAIYLYQEGRNEALPEFERLFRENPDDRQMRTNLIIAYRTRNRSVEAEKILKAALKKNGKDGEALLQRAEILIGKGQYAQAEVDLNQLFKLRPNGPEVHYVVGRLNLARGKQLPYRQELAESLRLNPELLAVRVELARNFIEAKEFSAALDLADHAPPFQRSAVPLLAQRNWALWGLGSLSEMRKGIDQGLAIARTGDFLVQDGIWKLRAGNPNAGRVALEQALNLDPNDLRALQGIYQSYLSEKKAPLGISRVKGFAAQHPEAPAVQQSLGELLMTAGRNEEARAAFEAARKADPNSLRADFSLVQVDMLDGKFDDARKRAEGVLSRDRTNQTAIRLLADIDLLRNQNDGAIQRLRQVVASDSANAEALNNLAYLLIEQQPDEALKYAQKAVEVAPDRPAYCDTLGWAFYRKGMYTSAVQYLRRAASEKGEAVWVYHLAMAYAKAGDLANGRRTLEAALKRNPNAPEAKLAREVLGQ